MKQKITLKNIHSYIEGNVQMKLDQLGLKPDWYKEQIAYRMLICKDDCMVKGRCIVCNCKVPDKMYVNLSCNKGERFPDIMGEEDWIKFKKDNGIK